MARLLAASALLVVTIAACGDSSPTPKSGDGGGSSAWRSAVGAGGLFAQTFDDATWKSRIVAPGSLFAVACVGNTIGWTAGERGFVAHTEDGGATWATQDAHLSGSLRAIRFGDAKTGVVAGDGGALAVTRDGGATWTTANVTTTTLRSAAVSAIASVMIVVGDRGTVLRSTDAGATWTTSTLGTADIRGVATDASARVVLAVDSLGQIWSSADRGVTFAIESTGAPMQSVAIDEDGSIALAVGAGAAMIRRNGTWATAPIPAGLDLHAALVSEGTLYAGGERGALVASPDGRTWTPRAIGSDAAIYALEDL